MPGRTGRLAALATLGFLVGCSSPEPAPASDVADVASRIDQVQDAVDTWRDASSLGEAQKAANRARVLITGPDVPGFAPEGSTEDVDVGLLPDDDGTDGVGSVVESCAGPDLLGGSWDDAAERWAILRTAIDEWAPGNNTFPSLPSHAQRVVGWASLTLATDNVEQAREYSSHAQLHVDASRDALNSCR